MQAPKAKAASLAQAALQAKVEPLGMAAQVALGGMRDPVVWLVRAVQPPPQMAPKQAKLAAWEHRA